MRYLYFILLGLGSSSVYAQAMDNNAITRSEFLKVTGALFMVLLFILVLSWLLRRLKGGAFAASSQGFKAMASMNLGAKEKVMLMKAGDRYLLLGITAGSITTLADFGEQLPQGFDTDPKPPFSDIIQSILRKREGAR